MNDTYVITKLPHRAQIHVRGDDRFQFLQGIITNDANLLNGSTRLLYACLLSPQGKFLHDFFIRNMDGQNSNSLIIDCESGDRAGDLYRRLTMYKLRSKIELNMIDNADVWQIFSVNGTDTQTGAITQSIHAYTDPRHPACGYRLYGSRPDIDIETVDFNVWDAHRIAHDIPDGSRDLIPEKSYIHEGRLDDLHAISYTKGCYIGQELVSRMHHRGLTKKILRHVPLDAIPEGAELRSSCGNIGLAVIKV